jgi:cell division protein DivIC
MKTPRVLGMLLASVVFVGVLFLFVLPGRTYLAQRRTLAAAETRVRVLSQATAELQQRSQQLQTDAEIERLARQQYGMTKPGEIPYAILPAQQPAPAPGPPPRPAKASRSLPSRVWHDLQFWN